MDIMAHAAVALRESKNVVILSGAGMSAESGIPTFRDKHVGLWEQYDPAELASVDAWQSQPDVVWAWYLWRLSILRKATPHAGYRALAAWAEFASGFDQQMTLVTQNVDHLHERTGILDCPSVRGLHKVHGSLEAFRCSDCHRPYPHDVYTPGDNVVEVDPPRCPYCGGLIRPGVVWFGEELPQDVWQSSVVAVTECDALLVIGTSSLVYPAAMLPELALDLGKTTIEVNPHPTPMTDAVTYPLLATAGQALPALVEAITAGRS